ncbi:hypothetical protein BJ742DRAFT_321200 [Cladochytrium replicatum]|nr:hypothetical protein BJ742DRAFT_321200 [Cladochytrium replicatum]
MADSPTNPFGSPGVGGSPGVKKASMNQSLRPVTIKQVLEAKQPVNDTPYTIDGVDVTMVSIVGRVISVSRASTNVSYTIDDGTGQIDVKEFMDNSSNDGSTEEEGKAPIAEDQYVKVVALVKVLNKRIITATRTPTLLSSPDEITYHNLQALYGHLYAVRGPANASRGPQSMSMNAGGGAYGAYNAGAGSYGGPGMGQNYGGAGNGHQVESELSALQDKIVKILSGARFNEGMEIASIVQQLRATASEADIRNAADCLVGEGHAYSTIHEEHIRLTSFDS